MKEWILCGCSIPILSLALKDHRRHCWPSRPWVFGNAEDMSRKQQASLRGSQLDSGTHSLIVTLGSISSELRDLREISVLDLSFPAITVTTARVRPPSQVTVTGSGSLRTSCRWKGLNEWMVQNLLKCLGFFRLFNGDAWIIYLCSVTGVWQAILKHISLSKPRQFIVK